MISFRAGQGSFWTKPMKKTFLIASILISTSQSYASCYKDNSFLPEMERGAWVFTQHTSRMPLPQQSLSGYACTLPTQPNQTLLEPLSDPYTLVLEDFSFCPGCSAALQPTCAHIALTGGHSSSLSRLQHLQHCPLSKSCAPNPIKCI